MLSLSPDPRVRDEESGRLLKPHQAQSRIDAGVAVGKYDETGRLVSFRRMTVEEMRELRAEESKKRRIRELADNLEPSDVMCPAEITGLKYVAQKRQDMQAIIELAYSADWFVLALTLESMRAYVESRN